MWRRPKFLSPSALGVWVRNQEEYFLKYLATNRPPRFLQTEPMSVGSAFDAYVKSRLYADIFGPGGGDSDKFVLDTLFEKQVESHNRTFAKSAGALCFLQYCHTGAYDKILRLCNKSTTPPRMEHKRQESEIGDGSVILLGIPDLSITPYDIQVTLDWKVNGFCSKSPVSPVPGFMVVQDGWLEGKASRGNNQAHKDYMPAFMGDLEHNMIPHIEEKKPEWAVQLSVYSWLAGCPVGSDVIIIIDQLACKPGQLVRVAHHRCQITPGFQQRTYDQFQSLWDTVQSDYIFRHLSEEDSHTRCETLNKQAATYEGDTTNDDWLREIYSRG